MPRRGQAQWLLDDGRPSWHAKGAGDFNVDGRSDILLSNTSRAVALWELNGTSIIGGGVIANPGPTWHV